MDNEFINRVLDYTQKHLDCKAREMAELAPGIAAVYDASNEVDTYFDRKQWEASNHPLWGNSLFPPGLEGTGIGVLQGVGSMPRISDFDQALGYAQRNLKSTTADVKMYEQPQKVDLEQRL